MTVPERPGLSIVQGGQIRLMVEDAETLLHGCCVAWQGRGLLILGASGSGKSTLAVEMMAFGAALVADDRVLLRQTGGGLVADCPNQFAAVSRHGASASSMPIRMVRCCWPLPSICRAPSRSACPITTNLIFWAMRCPLSLGRGVIILHQCCCNISRPAAGIPRQLDPRRSSWPHSLLPLPTRLP